MAGKSKILVIGGTGYIGKYIVEESAKAGHPTFALVRESTASNPEKSQVIESFKSSGVTILYGDIYNHDSLLKAIKQVDIVISTVGSQQIADQAKIIAAIKEAGNIKRFLPSEFGPDVDCAHAVEPAASFLGSRPASGDQLRLKGFHILTLCPMAPPRDKVVIIGDGNPKATFVKEEDVATYTIKAVDDPRTLNKILYLRPPANILSFNEIVSLWEKKISKTLEKIYVLEDELLKKIEKSPVPINLFISISHSVFVKGDAGDFEIDASVGVKSSDLYPEVKYTTLDEHLDQFI
ncbi:hypothetical protein SLA2020_452890 [Shorea laevis]